MSYGNGVLSGTDSALTNGSGLATLAGLRIDSSGRKALTVTSTGLTSATSDTFSILPIRLSVKVFIEGPYNTGTGFMNTTLKSGGYLATHFGGISIPAATVDSINIEIRDSVTVAQATVRRFAAAWLMSDGSIKLFSDTTKAYVELEAPRGSYYVVVRHRNHLAVMSAVKAVYTTDSTGYDFSTGIAKYYGSDAKNLGGGKYGMYAGENDGDNLISVLDYNAVGLHIFESGYFVADHDMDGLITVLDYNPVGLNVFISSQVP